MNTTTEFSDQERESEDSDADSTYLGQWEKSPKYIELQREQEPQPQTKATKSTRSWGKTRSGGH